MFFQIIGSVAIAAFLGYLSWQIQRISARMEAMSDSLNARMDGMSDSLNARMDSLSARMDSIMLDVGEIKGEVGNLKGQIAVINQRLDENDKAHAALAQRIEDLAVALNQ